MSVHVIPSFSVDPDDAVVASEAGGGQSTGQSAPLRQHTSPNTIVTIDVEIISYKGFSETFVSENPDFPLGPALAVLGGKDIHVLPLPIERAAHLIRNFNSLAELRADQPVLARTRRPIPEEHLRLRRPLASARKGARAGAKPDLPLERPVLEPLPKAWTAAFTRQTMPFLRSAGIRPVVEEGCGSGPARQKGVYLACDPCGPHAAAQVRLLAGALGLEVAPPPPPSYVVYHLLATGEAAEWAAAMASFSQAVVRVCGPTTPVQWGTRLTVAVGHRHAAFEREVGPAVAGHRVERVGDKAPAAAAARGRYHEAATAPGPQR